MACSPGKWILYHVTVSCKRPIGAFLRSSFTLPRGITLVYLVVRVSGAPNDGFPSDLLKRYFRLSGVPLKLCRFILGCAIIFLSVRSF